MFETQLQQRLTPGRYRHVCAVRSCAARLAEKYGESVEEAELAGLLHDYARELPESELLAIGEARGLIVSEVDRWLPLLLHAPVGAVLIEEELGITNPRILEAVAWHTLGHPDMGRLAGIIYIADMIADGRDYPGLERLRRVAEEDLDRALLLGFSLSMSYCLEKKSLIHPQTVAAWNHFLREVKRY